MERIKSGKSLLKFTVLALVVALLSACGSDSGGTAATTTTPTTTTPTTPTTTPTTTTTTTTPTTVSFATGVQPIFTTHCVSCHTLNGAANFLVLDKGTYVNLVNRPASASPGTLVIPGDSANSVLFKRITGALSANLQQMPLGGPFLTSGAGSEIELIKTWIDEGAKNN